MGNPFSSQKQTTTQVLEQLEKDIIKLESQRRQQELKQKRTIFYFDASVFVTFLIGVLYVLYRWYVAQTVGLFSSVFYIAVFLLFLVVVRYGWRFCHSKLVQWKDENLVELRTKRREILDNVRETETYKTALEILEKYDPNVKFEKAEKERLEREKRERELMLKYNPSLRQRSNVVKQTPTRPSMVRSPAPPTAPQSRLIYHFPTPQQQHQLGGTPRMVAATNVGASSSVRRQPMAIQQGDSATEGGSGENSDANETGGSAQLETSVVLQQQQQFVPYSEHDSSVLGTPQMARGIPPKDRTPFDKVLDFFVGDGPSNRFALICRQCSAHNGMASADEFEYLAFRCCYCFAFNPARKQRPLAPSMQLRTARLPSATVAGDVLFPTPPMGDAQSSRRLTPFLTELDDEEEQVEAPEQGTAEENDTSGDTSANSLLQQAHTSEDGKSAVGDSGMDDDETEVIAATVDDPPVPDPQPSTEMERN